VKATFRWIAIAALAFVLAMVLGTLIPRPLWGGAKFENATASRSVLLLSNAIHTDIAFPADGDVLERLGFLAKSGLPLDNPNVKWIILGWGGRSFFIETPTWADLKPMPVFRALTVDNSVMHTVLAGEVTPNGKDIISIKLSPAAFDAMLMKSLERFSRGAFSQPVLLPGTEYGEFDRFYEGVGAFNAIVGCNTWTAGVLRAGGLKTGLWNMLPFSLHTSLEIWNGQILQ
jgi:uncharacterized protein (TIGR02117 family)